MPDNTVRLTSLGGEAQICIPVHKIDTAGICALVNHEGCAIPDGSTMVYVQETRDRVLALMFDAASGVPDVR